jgi:hypothetical protein
VTGAFPVTFLSHVIAKERAFRDCGNLRAKREIATPPKSKSGGSQ